MDANKSSYLVISTCHFESKFVIHNLDTSWDGKSVKYETFTGENFGSEKMCVMVTLPNFKYQEFPIAPKSDRHI